MFTITLILFWLIDPKPAELELIVDAGRCTKYSVFIDDQRVPAGIIRTEPLRWDTEVIIDIAWLDGNKIEWRSFSIILYPGYRVQWKIELPRVCATWYEC